MAVYTAADEIEWRRGPQKILAPGEWVELAWTIPSTGGLPISAVGVEVSSATRVDGALYLDFLTWDGAPDIVLANPGGEGVMWRQAWVNGVDQYDFWWPEAYRLVQNRGRGLLSQGTREWRDYTVRASVTLHLAAAAGLAARVQGMQRYYALLLTRDGMARLVKALDGDSVLAEAAFAWSFGATHDFALTVHGNRIEASIDGRVLFAVEDVDRPLDGGGVALVVEEGRIMCEAVAVAPVEPSNS